MSRLTRSTTRRFLKRFLKPWAIRPSISRTYRSGWPKLDLGFGPARTLLVKDGLDALLLAPFDDAPVLRDVDGDALSRHHIRVAPDPRIADQHHAQCALPSPHQSRARPAHCRSAPRAARRRNIRCARRCPC